MAKPRTLLITGYGINCDDETRYAFERAGAVAEIVHVNDLIAAPARMKDFQILVFPGGFSYGDDTGSGKALSNRIKNNLSHELADFISRDTLVLGICNGFQVMVSLGLVPALKQTMGEPEVALEHNRTHRYQCRWVDLRVEGNANCVFTRGMDTLHIPVAHGEGNFYAPADTLKIIENTGLITMRYVMPGGAPAQGQFPFNPNGSINDIAALCDTSGRIMGMMPHPERGMFFNQRDDWTYLKEKYTREGREIPVESDGIFIFKNAVNYFSN